MPSSQSNAQPESTAKEEAIEEQDKNQELFPIVGIGASAGGLEAFSQLLKHLPIDTGMQGEFILEVKIACQCHGQEIVPPWLENHNRRAEQD